MRKFNCNLFLSLLSLLVFLGFTQVQAQTISGIVTDNTNGEGIPGVNILIKNTTSGTISDVDGNYNLEAPGDATLVFSFVGFETQEVNVAGRQVLNVLLAADLTELSEVVVVGYGTQRKVDLTGAVGSITAEQITARPITSPDQALAGPDCRSKYHQPSR